MIMQRLFLLLLAFIPAALSAQDDDLGKRTTIVFVTSETIATDNFDKDAFLAWVKATQQAIGGIMKTEKSNSTVKIIAGWVKDGKCKYDISVCPGNDGLAEKVNTALKNIESPVAKITSFQLLFGFKFNDGCAEAGAFSPEILTATEKLTLGLTTQSLVQRKEVLRNWALQEVIPVLAHYTSSVNDQFAGVKKTGDALSGKKFLNKETNNVTDRNSLYWRGVLEMNKGNLLIPVSKMFMHVANDEFDLARRYIGVLYRFADKGSLASHYLQDLNKYLNLFYKYHDSLVKKGIAFHDAGKFDKAIETYNSILADYSNSAWARYELYFSTNAKNQGLVKNASKTTALWDQHKAGVYTADPLYPMGGGANNVKDGYMLLRHLRVSELLKDSKKLKEDMVEYAGIAMDLEAYSFAGHLYWYLFSTFPEEKYKGHNFLAYFLYSLQKLGVTEVQSFFKGDYKNEFTTIDTEREQAMKSDPTYQSFKEQ
jgi:hypothetical protein